MTVDNAFFGERDQRVTKETQSWKLFCLLPFWLLRRPQSKGRVGKAELTKRFEQFDNGQWAKLHEEAERCVLGFPQRHHTMTNEERARAAEQCVQEGEVSRARQCLTGAALAPGTDATFQEMQRRRPQALARPLSEEVLDFEPDSPVELDRSMFLASLKSAPRGSSSGPGGWTYEHLKGMLDNTDTFELLLSACNSLSQAKVPREIADALMGARLTALTKPDGGVRGIATGCSLRRLVARTLAKQFCKVFEAECSPFQYTLSTRAGTDCVGHMLRAATDANPTATILSVDGIGAYDHVHRAAMLGRLARMPAARALLPFVRLSYGRPSSYTWCDDAGEQRTVTQAEGGEQGDPLMPLLFSIGIQGVLEEVATHLVDGEQLCAFLDDVYLLCEPTRVEPLFKVLEESMLRIAGIQLHQGKTRAWNPAGVVPDNIAEIGEAVWQPEGITVLGIPIGTTQYTASKMEERIAKERLLWEAIPTVTDLQCAWQILLQSANPRANHSMRTLPPTLSAEYCHAHDEGIWSTAKVLLGGIPEDEEAHRIATLPMRSGPPLSSALCACSILGFVGRCVADDPATNPRRGHHGGALFGQ